MGLLQGIFGRRDQVKVLKESKSIYIESQAGFMTELPVIPNLIIIGGSSRNVGKTSLALKLIEQLAPLEKVTGLKVTSLRPGEDTYHGDHDNLQKNNFGIREELDRETSKDTSRMLRAGAERVFFIESPDHLLESAFHDFMKVHYSGGPLVCESRSLRRAVIPGLFVLLKHYNKNLIKPDFEYYESLADIIFQIHPQIINSESLAQHITWGASGWKLNHTEE
ncbi:MAG: hypothetical protein FD166_2724 [Bacteroidetes bacterium]|nr:MAG: hypothetical protein FD166_2724 [Bacteroidota bacterium]